jgi:nucleotidyltransferase substrate binding protein (TIGR01987 family)
MEQLIQKRKSLLQALSTLHTSIENFKKISKQTEQVDFFIEHEELYRAIRDSLIQRFEFCVDLFWKYIKKQLETMEAGAEFNAPVPIIRKAFSVGLISETQAENIIVMIKERNLTSHIYREEIAENLSNKIPAYYTVMQEVLQKLGA